MEDYLDLSRRFAHISKYSSVDMSTTGGLDKHLPWDKVLEGRFSIIVGRANFGKTMELKAKCRALRAEGQVSLYVALHKVLGEAVLEDALDPEDCEALADWKAIGGELTAFVDSLDEASLGTEDGIRKALRRLGKALDWPNANVRWVLSSRPAVLTEDVLALLQAELRTSLNTDANIKVADEDEIDTAFGATVDGADGSAASQGDVESADAASKTENKAAPNEQLKLYALLPLDNAGASLYLQSHLSIAHSKGTLIAARRYGLGRLTESPGGLDILAYIDPVQHPPNCLSQVYDKVVDAVQQQQRSDPRERRVGGPPPESLDEAIGRLAGASVVCQLPNIEMSPKALRYREGVLSARPIIASVLSEHSLTYLLGSRLFIDSGQYQVKLYPDELLPFLAAKHLASLVRSPDHARRLLANLTWRATTGECGVHRALLPLAGWLSVFNAHCRHEILSVEPQAVAFFGDLRHPDVQIHEASTALERTIERLVSVGDSLGRSFYTLTTENFWQASKPGLEPTLRRLFDKYGTDWHARDALLEIAGHARMEVFRDTILDAHGHDYSKLLDEQLDLNYILSLGLEVDLQALSVALKENPALSESRVARLLAKLAWKAIDARSMAEITAVQFRRGRGGLSIYWVLTRDVAQEAGDTDLYKLTRSLLLRLVDTKAGKGRDAEKYWADQKFVELVMDLLALVIHRSAVESSRSAKLCLVLSRHIRKNHHGNADMVKLRAALQENKEVRLTFLRGLIHNSDKTADGISRAIFMSESIYKHIKDDEVELGEPGFSELIKEMKEAAARPHAKPTKHLNRHHIVDKKSKIYLLGILDGLRDASNERALSWVAQWLVHSIDMSRYSECDFDIFEKEAGPEIAQAVREGLSVLWRTKDPTWREDEPNSTYNITIAGLHGLHIELGDGSKLPALTELEVRRAIRYAQFEINGQPKWFWSLVAAHEQVAAQELSAILSNTNRGQVSFDKADALIRYLDNAPISVQRSLAPEIWDFAIRNAQLTEHTSEAALRVAAANDEVIDQTAFEAEAWRRMDCAFKEEIPELGEQLNAATSEEHEERQNLERKVQELRRQRSNAIVWGSFWLWTYPDTFTKQWEGWRESNPNNAERFMLALAAHLGEDRGTQLKQVSENGRAGLKTLQMLYEWVRSIVDEEDDNQHEDGLMFSPGERDHAERLRDALVPAIAHAKSEQAYEVLEELRMRAAGPRAKYLRKMQFMMREEQYATKPIAQTDYPEFERTFAPQASTYIEFAMAIETDLLSVKSQIETGDFSLRRFFNSLNFNRVKTDNDGLALEEDFQALLGSELNHAADGRYIVALEPILPEGTRRDVLCQKGSLRATVELKMSLRWTLNDYVEALEKQLQGQYMMAPDSKIGFFVIVLQKTRSWDGPDGKPIKFDDVLTILRKKAREKEIEDSSVYLRVIGINATQKEDFRASRRKNMVGKNLASAKYADETGNMWSGQGRKPTWLKDALSTGKKLEDFLVAKHNQ